ncbi:MAG: GntR family transcriptional regulator [Janthinobacterium lividum]
MTNQNTLTSRRIAETLAERIHQGVYLPGSRLPAEREMAAEFDLDRSVVRAALSELTRTGLIVREPGCRPRVSQTAGSRTAERPPRRHEAALMRAIAVILPQHQADHGSREIIRGISHVLRSQEAPYRSLIFDTNLRTATRSALEQEACEAVEQEGLAGAIVWPTLEGSSLEQWRSVQAQGHPVVFVDRYDEALSCDFVGIDNYASAREAVEYLLGLGHTRIAHLTHDPEASSIQERAAGYEAALHFAGLPKSAGTTWVMPSETFPECIENFVTWFLETEQPPTAVFALNDQIAHILIARLEARGKRVPEDLSVMGFDDDDMYSARPALLTTMRQPFERIGQRAAEILLRRLSSPLSPTTFLQVLMPTHLVERSTCRSLEKF